MKVELKIFDSLLCATEIFKVNNINCKIKWFIYYGDCNNNEEGEEYICNKFISKHGLIGVRSLIPDELILMDAEIEEIQKMLENGLVTGGCSATGCKPKKGD